MRTLAALMIALLPAISAAQYTEEPPARVGRVSWTQGEVLLYAEPDRGWEKAYVNSPLTSENSLWTDPGARAELRVGSTAIRLEEATQLDFQRLDDTRLQAHVARGAISVSIRHFESGERYSVSTPQGRFLLRAAGRYRIDADADRGLARLTVFSGTAELDASSGRIRVEAGQAVRVVGTYEFESAATTAFDDWAFARDERIADGQTARYVSPRMTGYEELESWGEWAAEPDYGAVWYPARIAVDWAPYRYGHWAWRRPWGWTWIDNAPWGYAPFHYGRWVYHRGRWGWTPGRYVARPIWAPALVAWVGGAGWNVTISGGNAPAIGWYPLAPWDRYQPWYTRNTTYINNVNVVVLNRPPRDRYQDHDRDRDHNRNRGATVVLRENFVQSRPVSSTMVPLAGEVVRAQPVVQGAAVLPGRAELARSKPVREAAPQATVPAMPGQAVQAAPGSSVPMAVSKPAAAAPAAPAYRAPVAGPAVAPQTKPLRTAPSTATAPAPATAAPVPKPKPAPGTVSGSRPLSPQAIGQPAGGRSVPLATESRSAPQPGAQPAPSGAKPMTQSAPKPVAKPAKEPQPDKDSRPEGGPKPTAGERVK